MSEPVRVCLLVNNGTISEWQRRALDQMIAETSAEITVVVRNQADTSRSRTELLQRAIELREWTIVWAFRRLFGSSSPMSESVEIAGLEYLEYARQIDCVPKTVDGWKNEISQEIATQVAEDADVAIRFGFGFLVGDILTELEHGVLSFHHGDIREYRGQPMGCWEYIHGDETAGVTLQRINEELDAGDVAAFKTISIAEADTYREVKDKLLAASGDILATAIKKIESDKTVFDTYEELGELYTIPSGMDVARFALKELRGGIRRFAEQG